jgi:hypothetical protein
MNDNPFDITSCPDDIQLEPTLDEGYFGGLFSPLTPPEFVNPELDFSLDPDHFIKWLEAEQQEVIGEYHIDVQSMCEYSTLYIGMLLAKKKLEGELTQYYGKFGFFEHYWIGYTYKGVEYFIDLTLQQFVKDAPKVAISLASKSKNGYKWLSESAPMDLYLAEVRAFQFYKDPNEIA